MHSSVIQQKLSNDQESRKPIKILQKENSIPRELLASPLVSRVFFLRDPIPLATLPLADPQGQTMDSVMISLDSGWGYYPNSIQGSR